MAHEVCPRLQSRGLWKSRVAKLLAFIVQGTLEVQWRSIKRRIPILPWVISLHCHVNLETDRKEYTWPCKCHTRAARPRLGATFMITDRSMDMVALFLLEKLLLIMILEGFAVFVSLTLFPHRSHYMKWTGPAAPAWTSSTTNLVIRSTFLPDIRSIKRMTVGPSIKATTFKFGVEWCVKKRFVGDNFISFNSAVTHHRACGHGRNWLLARPTLKNHWSAVLYWLNILLNMKFFKNGPIEWPEFLAGHWTHVDWPVPKFRPPGHTRPNWINWNSNSTID